MPTMPSLIFPSTGLQVLSAVIHFLGVTILSHCLSRRLAAVGNSWHGLSQLLWPRLCVTLVFLDSWMFLFSGGVLIFGVGLELKGVICGVAIYLCITFYATSKILIYFFLIERVHVVWSGNVGTKRLGSKMYILCFTTVCLYMIVIALLCLTAIGRIHLFRPDGACVIGLKPFALISLLSYDLYINVFLTGLFLWPLLRANIVNVRVKRLAIRTLLAAAVALTTSTANFVILAILGGRELGWICLGSCGADVIVNACALFYATAGAHSRVISTNTCAIVDIPTREQDRALQLSGKQGQLDFDVTSAQNQSPTGKGNFADQLHRGRLSEYLPHSPIAKGPFTPSPSNDGHRSESNPGPEVGKRINDSRNSLSILKSVTGLFCKEQPREEYGLQINITTEREHHHHANPTDLETGVIHEEGEESLA